MDYVYKIEPKEMFHIPLDMRGIVKTQRYSTSGYPCLYLGESIYGCWEEMRRPPMIKCAVSRLECSLKLNIVDLSIPSEIDMTNPAYQRLIPLIISCMVPVENHNDTYKPEYIIPQLIIEWVLKNRNKGIDGVCYTSTHMSDDFDFPEDKMLNYAIPIYDTDPRHRYCKKLCSMFKVTKPTTNEIEQLKIGYDINIGTYGGSIDDIKRERYENSNFGNLEKRLNDKRKFPLTQILYKG